MENRLIFGRNSRFTSAVQEWLRDNNVQQLEWPGNSPDLNPIENLWAVLKRKVSAHHPTGQEDLRKWILHVWREEIGQELCERLCDSMPTRIQCVLRAHGWPTRY